MGAKFTGSSIAPDENDQITLSMDYDGKRDRWNGYDPDDHMRIVEEYAKVDVVSVFSPDHSPPDLLNFRLFYPSPPIYGAVFAFVMLSMFD